MSKIGYVLSDIFGPASYAEGQKELYGKILKILVENLNIVNEQMACLRALEDDHTTLSENTDEAEGKIQSVFEEKVDFCKGNIDKLTASIDSYYAEYTVKKASIEALYDYWCREAEREDAEYYAKTKEEYEEG